MTDPCEAGDERMTQKAIAEAADTTEVTLRNRRRDLRELVAETGQYSWIIERIY